MKVTLRPVRTVLVAPSTSGSNHSTATLSQISRGTLPQLTTAWNGLWYAGDYCTVLHASIDVNFLMVLVHHVPRPSIVSRRVELICLPLRQQGQDDSGVFVVQWRRPLKTTIAKVSVSNDKFPPRQNLLRTLHVDAPLVPSHGRLQDGRMYFVDHVLLYSGGFSQFRFKKGSAGGTYCLSLNYPPNRRRSRERVRILTRTPPGISTTEGLRSVIDDLVTSSTIGTMVRNAEGDEMLLFTVVAAYICDYHEIASVLDVMGQSGNVPCHLCSFLRYDGHQITGSQYCSNTEAHSGDPCYARTGQRMRAIRASDTDDDVLATLGFNGRGRVETKVSPLVQFYERLNEKLETVSIPLTEHNYPVVNPSFDPYRSVLVAPDHLLAGIAINEVTLAFKALPGVTRRRQADEMICQFLRTNGLPQQSGIFNFKTSALHTTSISSTFCILLIAAPVFKEVVDNLDEPGELSKDDKIFVKRIINNLCSFRQLVASTYWYPTRHVDEPRSIASFNDDAGMAHISKLQEMCVEYLTECNNICKLSPLATKELDKPNTHRLLELYHHSIPAMGHVRHFAELVFECAHQPLKRAMANSNFRDSHLQSMNHSIADDWKGRLSAAFGFEDAENEEGLLSILNVLCGRQDEVRDLASQHPTLRDAAMQLLRNELMKRMIGSVPRHMDCTPFEQKWCLTDLCETSTPPPTVQQLITEWLPDTNLHAAKCFQKAKRVKVRNVAGSERWSPVNRHDTVRKGNVVQALVVSVFGGLLLNCTQNSAEETSMYFISYFVVEALVQASNLSTYAAVRKCDVDGKGLLRVQQQTDLQLLLMNDSVRRVGVVHACATDSILRCIGPNVAPRTCAGSVLDGHWFHYFNRETGYPPRMA